MDGTLTKLDRCVAEALGIFQGHEIRSAIRVAVGHSWPRVRAGDIETDQLIDHPFTDNRLAVIGVNSVGHDRVVGGDDTELKSPCDPTGFTHHDLPVNGFTERMSSIASSV
ncbi:hypothetical protein AB0M12_15995 [Nocardia vinacea]|uniref:hypothetical protein n=1 Tax=Nocardia vinacea TaxID=96468 RepID=UPI00342EFAB8